MKLRSLVGRSCLAAVGLAAGAAAQAGWELDPSHMHVSFDVSHLGLTRTPGIFRKAQGEVRYDDAKVEASSVRIVIDAASIDTVNAQRDKDLQGPDWFDAQAHPAITFVSRSVQRVDERNYLIRGELTIRGKTLPVAFTTVLTNRATNPFIKVPMVGFVGEARIRRSDFGLVQYPAVIGDEVTLRIALELLEKP